MLGGGYYRGASVLITGSPGTAKTTLAGAFAASGLRPRRAHAVRQLRLAGGRGCPQPRLGRHRSGALTSRAGLLRIAVGAHHQQQRRDSICCRSARSLARARRPLRCDRPAVRAGEVRPPSIAAERRGAPDPLGQGRGHHAALHQPARRDNQPDAEATALQISTLADTWIHLSYLVQAGERNRGAVDHQVARHRPFEPGARADPRATRDHPGRHLHRGRRGADGHLRWEKERAERTAAAEREDAAERLRLRLEAEALELEGRLRSLQHELVAKRADMARLAAASQKQVAEASDSQTARYRMRWGDRGMSRSRPAHD